MKAHAAIVAVTSALVVFGSLAVAADDGAISRNRRKLFFQAPSINSVIDFFVPIFNGAIQLAMPLVPIAFVDESLELGEIDFGACTASATLQYSLGAVRGLETFEIESFELIPGTELWEYSWGGLGGASWNGTWIFKATFDSIESETAARVTATACNVAIDEYAGGSIVMQNVSLDLEVTIAGHSPNLFLLGSSVADSITVSNTSGFHFDSLTANIGGFGSDIDFDVGTFLEDTFLLNFNQNELPEIRETLNTKLGHGLKFHKL